MSSLFKLSSEDWLIKEKGFHPHKQGQHETLFTLGNGYLCVRGAFEENPKDSYRGIYIAGIFDKAEASVPELVKAPTWLDFSVWEGNKKFSFDTCHVLSHERILDLKKGILHRTTRFKDSKERILRIEIKRVVFAHQVRGAIMDIKITPENFSGELKIISGLDVKLAPNLVEATQDTGAFVMYSSALKRLAVKLSKICNDLRLLSSGPRAGLNEINLPKMQPGSSIMPGKINPVIPEVVNQIAFKVIGNDLTVTLAAEAGQLELNVMEPVIAQSIFESVEMLKNGIFTLTHRCIKEITANEKHCREMVENSIGLVTALNPVLGYETCTRLAKEALETNRGVYELVLEKKLLSERELNNLLSPEHMINPQQKLGFKE